LKIKKEKSLPWVKKEQAYRGWRRMKVVEPREAAKRGKL